jgi:hypothetical protein
VPARPFLVLVGRVEQLDPEVLAGGEVDVLSLQVEDDEQRALRDLALLLDERSHRRSNTQLGRERIYTRRILATIGVYGWTLEAFLAALRQAEVFLVLDVRQRRGVRGRDYAWANARRLQAALSEPGIGYRHHPELAPTTELRQLQYREHDRLGVGKRSRAELAPEYRERYLREILDPLDLGPVVAELPAEGAGALLCVERDPEACHRSLIAERLSELGLEVVHLRP